MQCMQPLCVLMTGTDSGELWKSAFFQGGRWHMNVYWWNISSVYLRMSMWTHYYICLLKFVYRYNYKKNLRKRCVSLLLKITETHLREVTKLPGSLFL